jgi:uncharacterized protein
MISRQLSEKAKQLFQQFPSLMITGPRQSGKTTLIKSLFSELPYVSLEEPDVRQRALEDPRSFLKNYPNGAILDEVQRVPNLFSYLQSIIDSNADCHFVLSGSQHFLLMEQVSQSLAGRVAILQLLPLSLSEMKNANLLLSTIEETLFFGGYPRIFNQQISPYDFHTSYLQTYVERDVRQLRQVSDLDLFVRFIKMCAGRIGQLLNIHSLASDVGISTPTAQAWLSVLQTSHIIFLLQPHFKNFNKRLVKTPKLYFNDTGLACNLLGLEKPEQLISHFLRGGLFENLIILELLKNRYNQGKKSNLYFWRDNHGHEIDCLIENVDRFKAIEIKSSQTTNAAFFDGLSFWKQLTGDETESSLVVFGGDGSIQASKGDYVSWRDLERLF